MTRAHRRHHLIAWVVLGPAILGVLIGALVVRAHARLQVSRPTAAAAESRP